jgi:exodeoxyribonuclease V gamma subunit
MNQTLLADRLQGLDFAERADLFRIRGELPHGVFGNLALAREQGPIEVVRKRVQPLLAAPLDDLEIDLKLGGLHLQGWLKGMTEEGLLTYRVSAFNGKDLMRLWLRHLVLNALEIKGIPCVSLHIDTKEEKRMSPLKNSETARKFLSDLLALYWRGLSQPLPLFPRSSYKYAEKFAKKEDQEAAMKEALGTWNGNAFRSISGEGEDAYNQVAFRGVNPLSGEFEQLARQVYGTALEYLQ